MDAVVEYNGDKESLPNRVHKSCLSPLQYERQSCNAVPKADMPACLDLRKYNSTFTNIKHLSRCSEADVRCCVLTAGRGVRVCICVQRL